MNPNLQSVQINRRDARAEFKFAGSPGSFEGYAAVFGNVDQGGDCIVANAFKQAVTDRNGQVLVLYQHSARDPIGKATVNQDSRGLHVRGALALRDATAAKAHALMESGVLDAMSIGYEILPGGAEYAEGVRILTALMTCPP